jgi:hypothetical protein
MLDGVATLALTPVEGGRGRSDSEVGVNKDKSNSESSESDEEGKGAADGSSEDTDEGEDNVRSVAEGGAITVGGGSNGEGDGEDTMEGARLGTSLAGTEIGGCSPGSESSIEGAFGVPSNTSVGILSISLGQISAVVYAVDRSVGGTEAVL